MPAAKTRSRWMSIRVSISPKTLVRSCEGLVEIDVLLGLDREVQFVAAPVRIEFKPRDRVDAEAAVLVGTRGPDIAVVEDAGLERGQEPEGAGMVAGPLVAVSHVGQIRLARRLFQRILRLGGAGQDHDTRQEVPRSASRCL